MPAQAVRQAPLGGARLVDEFTSGRSSFALCFAGQGFDWLGTLARARAAGAGTQLPALLQQAAELLAPVADEIAGLRPHGFDPCAWAEEVAAAGVAETPGAAATVVACDPVHAAVSVPGILAAQVAVLESLQAQGLPVESARTAVGHSQGVLAVELLRAPEQAASLLALAQLMGAAVARQARVCGMVQQGELLPMLLVAGVDEERLQRAIDAVADGPGRPAIGLRNARDAFVVVGRPEEVARVQQVLEAEAARDAAEVQAKRKGGAPFAPTFTPLEVQVGFHHPAFQPAVEQVAAWAEACGMDAARARQLAQTVIVDPVDWVATTEAVLASGAQWVLDCGPADGVEFLTADILAGRGVGTLAVAGAAGQQALFDAGHAPARPVPYTAFAPRVERAADGTLRVVTRFTELTGRSPMLLPGMTPTTADPEIVAAAANAGHWAELAGGGQVTPEHFARTLARLEELLDPGVAVQFNSMFLDPYLWKMQIGGTKLVPRARAAGAPIDGVVVTAGIPEREEAVALVHELRAAGLPWVVFKPGAVRQIEQVLDIARAVPEVPIIIQVEGGHAGGHHSWEDLDELLIATYGQIREVPNTVLCVGGGIGTPERAASYLMGTWAEAHGLPAMPVDGVLLGTVAMATKEAKTSPAVKQLLVETTGVDGWVPAGAARGGMASGRSQLGADIHEIDNSAARCGRLLDEVAGDADAVAARREEIIAALAKTAKPYFGDVEDMTYGQWLARYVELAGPQEDYPGWVDVSWARRLGEMLDRAEARLSEADHGAITSRLPEDLREAALDPAATAAQVTALLHALEEAYPQATSTTLHPADVVFFRGLCRTPGKPVGFVPVIDADVRRWWRSDSLWQAHDPRFAADAVCVIPGTSAVAGIERADEPVAELLGRFCAAAADAILAAEGLDATSPEVPAAAHDVVAAVLAAPCIEWAGRGAANPVHLVGAPAEWELDAAAGADSSAPVVGATHPASGARLRRLDAEHAELEVPLLAGAAGGSSVGVLRMRLTLETNTKGGACPRVTAEDAAAAMAELTRIAAGGTLPTPDAEGVARWDATLDAARLADYRAVTEGFLPQSTRAVAPAGDVLVGLAWPAIFSAVAHATVPADASARRGGAADSLQVVEGMLSLVHLEHHLTLASEESIDFGALAGVGLVTRARVDEITDTDMGRVVVVRASLRRADDDSLVARLTERFAIRGRTGTQTARTNTSILPSVVDTPRSFRAQARVRAPQDLRPFAVVSGDRNPIHVAPVAAALAGLPGVIVHGMWTSAVGQLVAAAEYREGEIHTPAAEVVEYTATMLAPVLPGQEIEFLVERAGIDSRPGRGEVRQVVATVAGQPVLQATAVVRAPRTFYAFPGQGIQSQGMGMAARARSRAARDIWDRADAHTRAHLGFSILEIVENNPQEVVVAGERFFHPQGVLFLTQFTQVAMACLGVAQVAEMAEAHVLDTEAFFAGHSVGEYNALAAYAGVLSLESVVEIVYRRGLTMHRLVDRDDEGRSNYGLAALRPHKMGLGADDVAGFVARMAAESGEFLEIVNYNLAGLQYAVAGTVAGLKALAAAAEAAAPGQRALIMIPGIDVPFHSTRLRGGVDDFRAHLDRLLPAEVDLAPLQGRYIPNLVARPFELSRSFVDAMLDVVDPERIGTSETLSDINAHFDTWAQHPTKLGRALLVELLAWQFASPVRWIETQHLALEALGLDRFVEVGVGSAPTIANMMGQTLRLPAYARHADRVEVLNVERDAAKVFATDDIPRPSGEDTATEADAAEVPGAPGMAQSTAPDAAQGAAPGAEAAAAAAPAAPAAERPADLVFGPADATAMLIALWTKVRPDQMGATDSIETLVEGVSSRRNQLLLDLGVEFGVGAIDGAADAELADLQAKVSGVAKGYQAFGPVLGDAVADALRRLTGPAGARPGDVAARVREVWGLGEGWADHVTAAVVLGAREGASLRGGELAFLSPASPSSAAELEQLVDAAVQHVAAARGISVALPAAAGAAGGVVDSAALGAFAEQVTGKAGVLAATARTILAQLGLDHRPKTEGLPDEDADRALFDLVAAELGPEWPRLVSQSFSADKAVLLDDRWASAREDVARVAAGELTGAELAALDVTGTGRAVAELAEWLARRSAASDAQRAEVLRGLAAQARENTPLPYADDVAVVTGASPHSIAAAVTGGLLAGGATVVATTSSLSHERLEFYKELYRTHARGAAALWVVPANLSSFSDLDAVIEWIGAEQTATVNGAPQVTKPRLVPTLLFPFAAPRVQGSLAEVGPRAENEMRLLLWAVEKLIAGCSALGADTHVGHRLHVVLPGSPNRGRFGGDGAYGESKAALDALVNRWHAEPGWRDRASLVHAHIGWVRGTGLMGGNDPLVDAVEAAGVRTFATEEMAELLLQQISAEARAAAASAPVVCDYTGGLGTAELNLAELARTARAEAEATAAGAAEEEASRQLAALPNLPELAAAPAPQVGAVATRLEDMVVLVGAAELGPWGSSRTRWEAETTGRLSAAGVVELAWSMGLIRFEQDPTPGWYTADGDPIDEADIYDTFADEVLGRVGVRQYHDDFGMVDNLAPELTTIYLDHDVQFSVADEEAARSFLRSHPEHTEVHRDADTGEWQVVRRAGTPVRVPRRMAMSRFVGGQVPEGFDPAVWGIPADMVDNLDRVACWNVVATVDAFLSSGFTPAEVLRHLHPTRVSSTQGTGMGGMESMRSLYLDGLLAEPRANDILQEALPNVVAAHVMQSYVGGYGQMIHPVAACATAAVSVEEAMDKIRLGKADFVVAGGLDDLSIEGITGFGDMAATADSQGLRMKGIADRFFSRANDRRRAGFVESAGGGTLLLARGSVAADLGLPVAAVVGFAESFADGAHTSIPAPGLGALGAAQGGSHSRLARALADLDVTPDDIAVISKHDTSTAANDPNESDLHERLAAHLGRADGNPLYVISQKTLTGHAKGGAAAFQLAGLAQVLAEGLIPPNRSLDCVDPVLAQHPHLVWLRAALRPGPLKAGLVTSLGFGHVSALIALVHPEVFATAVAQQRGADAADAWRAADRDRRASGRLRILRGMHGGAPLYTRPVDRNLGATGAAAKEREAAVLLDPDARLVDGVLRTGAEIAGLDA
ncbi:fatty acid synthase subunit beta domain-containing protein [Corynebacterium sp. 13CS0277]|uniref:fatty acid synthase subunit beta domain-containing protein n=1 Tax=Corynebacterium sp. 13CS0277 TaxID=2071994 RepID=UPI003515A69E